MVESIEFINIVGRIMWAVGWTVICFCLGYIYHRDFVSRRKK